MKNLNLSNLRILTRSQDVPRLALVTLAALLAPVTASAQEQTSYTLAGPAVAVYDLAGAVTLSAGAGPDVKVEVTPKGRDAGRLKVATGELHGLMTLRVLYPEDRIVYPALGRGNNTRFSIREDGTWGNWDGEKWSGRGSREVTIRGSGDGLEAAADLRVAVPSGKRVRIFVGVGKVDASNLDGELYVDAAAADIATRGTRGSLDLDTGSGNIRVDGADGEVSLDTGSGDVSVSGTRNGALKVDTGSGTVSGAGIEASTISIDTGSGDIDLSDVTSPRLDLDTGSGAVRAALKSSPDVVKVDTGSGDVTLRLPADLSATVDLETSSGDLTVDFPLQLTRKDDSSLRGRIGEGRGRIGIETGSGDISLLR